MSEGALIPGIQSENKRKKESNRVSQEPEPVLNMIIITLLLFNCIVGKISKFTR